MCLVKANRSGGFVNDAAIQPGSVVRTGDRLGVIESLGTKYGQKARCDGTIAYIRPDGFASVNEHLYNIVPVPVLAAVESQGDLPPVSRGMSIRGVGDRSARPRAAAVPAADVAIVFVTTSGTRYHAAGCRSLHNEATAVSLGDVAGRLPCRLCDPPIA